MPETYRNKISTHKLPKTTVWKRSLENLEGGLIHKNVTIIMNDFQYNFVLVINR
jgi:hypothetical protein